MRGKVKPVFRAVWIAGITPAYAGKSFHNACQIILSQDHPRLCGEKLDGYSQSNFWTGSPPPMRGKADKFLIPSTCVRITPAYAGKSFFATHSGTEFRDHPRLCGEKRDSLVCSTSSTGSPPPMRGKVHETAAPNGYVGITPAYAGKSMESADEPVEIQGSPPPMRGKDQ